MPTALTQKYIDDHMPRLHTADSFGRALVEQALNAAKAKVGAAGVAGGSVEMDAKITVNTVEAQGCIQICAVINGVSVCYHQNI